MVKCLRQAERVLSFCTQSIGDGEKTASSDRAASPANNVR